MGSAVGRVVVADNGPNGGDELHVIESGADCGWPAHLPNSVAPDYVFPTTVAPTGLRDERRNR
jgi:glucose/arabinose dehydrogenase